MTRTLDLLTRKEQGITTLPGNHCLFFCGLGVCCQTTKNQREEKWWETQILNGSSRLLGLEDLATFFHHEKPEVKILEDFRWGDGENKKLA